MFYYSLVFISIRGSQRDVVYLGWPIAPSYMSPNWGGGGVTGSQQWVHLCTWRQNKLWRSYLLFNLWSPQTGGGEASYLLIINIFLIIQWLQYAWLFTLGAWMLSQWESLKDKAHEVQHMYKSKIDIAISSKTMCIQKPEWHCNIYYSLCTEAIMALQCLVQPTEYTEW